MAEQMVESRTLKGLKKLDPQVAAAMPKMISADSHAAEPDDLWNALPERLRSELPQVKFAESPPGGFNPELRVLDQLEDGIQAEILFPNYGLVLFGLDNIELQREAFRVYNDWIAGYCKVAPRNLFGVPCLSVYDIDAAIAEMHRCHDMGLVGAMVWQVPDPRLPFTSEHYEKLWAAAAEARAPIHCHILTGHSYAKDFGKFEKRTFGAAKIKLSVNTKQFDTTNTLFDFIFSGAFDRHPDLRLVLAESEVGWVPFMLQQWDYYFERFRKRDEMPIKRLPSEIFAEHVYCTFLEDFVGTRAFSWWGDRNCMWSNDYPHFNMTFPHSRENVEMHLEGLSAEKRHRLIRGNAIDLYDLADRL